MRAVRGLGTIKRSFADDCKLVEFVQTTIYLCETQDITDISL